MKSKILLTLTLTALSLWQFPSAGQNGPRQQPVQAQSSATPTANWERYTFLFFPAQKEGCAVSQYVTLEYNFNIYF